MGYLSLDEKYGLLTRLIELAKSDDVVNIAEISYIFWVSQQVEVSDSELKNLLHKTVKGSVPFSLPERVEIFHKCLTLVLIDGEVNQKELTHCEQIAKDLRLSESESLMLINQLRSNPDDMLNLETVKKMFRC